MNAKSGLMVLLLFVSLAGCGVDIDGDVESLVIAKNTWIEKSRGRDYSYTIIQNCFCTYDSQKIRVRVESGKAVSAKLESPNKHSGAIEAAGFRTIRQHFEFIFAEIELLATGHDEVVISVEYDSEIGNPSRIIRDRRGFFDARIEMRISGVAFDS